MDSKQEGLNPGSVCTVSFTAKPFCWSAIATDSLRDVNLFKSTTYEDFSMAGDSPRRTRFHSHSMVAGGFELTSYVTRLMPRTSLMIRPDTFLSSAYGSSAQSAVMKSLVCTARNATTYS